LGRRKQKNQILVGFAAETEDIFVNAQKKLLSKNLDLLVLNEISQSNPAFGSEENQVYFMRPDAFKKIDKIGKAQVASLIWDEILFLAGKV
jgi:phosphopantothenoylcysteine decarboxylase/phosphopantothenate--cysteine ligase